MAYLSLLALRDRVDGLLKLRSAAKGQGRPEGAAVHAVLRRAKLPWAGLFTLRETPMRVSTSLADALKRGPPARLRCTVANLHTTRVALSIADRQAREQMRRLLRDRARARS